MPTPVSIATMGVSTGVSAALAPPTLHRIADTQIDTHCYIIHSPAISIVHYFNTYHYLITIKWTIGSRTINYNVQFIGNNRKLNVTSTVTTLFAISELLFITCLPKYTGIPYVTSYNSVEPTFGFYLLSKFI